jgi:hypothetical protein
MRTPILGRLVGRSTSPPRGFFSIFASVRGSVEGLMARPAWSAKRLVGGAYASAQAGGSEARVEEREMRSTGIEREI